MADPYAANVTFLLEAEGTNGSTTFTDTSSANNTIVVNGDTRILTAQAKIGNSSAYFDGTGDWLEIASNANFQTTGDFTVEAWIYPTAYPFNIGGIICNGQTLTSTTTTRGLVLTSDGKVAIQVSGGLSLSSAAAAVPLYAWTHVALSRSGTTMYLFVNGLQVATGTQTFDLSLANTLIGRSKYNNDGYGLFQGYIDQVRLTKGVVRYATNFNVYDEFPVVVNTGSYQTFLEGFETIGDNDDLKERGWYNTNNGYLLRTGGRGGRKGWGQIATSTQPIWLSRLIPYSRYLTIGMAFYTETLVTGSANGTALICPGGQFAVAINSTHRLTVWRGATSAGGVTLLATDTNPISFGWHYLELKLFIDNTYGFYEVRLDGVPLPALTATNADTQNSTTNNYAGYIDFGWYNNSGPLGGGSRFDDIYINTSNIGSPPYFGDSRVDGYLLSNNEAQQDWDQVSVGKVRLLLNANGADGSTTLVDSSESNHTVAVIGDAKISTEQSKFGGSSMKFDGTYDSVIVDSANGVVYPGAGDYTLECWLYLTSYKWNWWNGIYQTVFDTRSNSTNGWLVYLTANGRLRIHELSLNGTGEVPLNQWTHIAVCKSKGYTRTFINGVLDSESTNARSLTSNMLTIGGMMDRLNDSDAKLEGYIDGFRYIDAAIYTKAFTPPTVEPSTVIEVHSPAWDALASREGGIYSGTVNDTSMFGVANMSHTPSAIHLVQVSEVLSKTDTGTRTASILLDSGGSVVTSDPIGLTMTDVMHHMTVYADPATSQPWSKAGVNGVKIGVKVAG